MQLEVGTILEGKVTGVLKFGAFVDLGNGKSGMVHISEVANTYVNDINEHLKEGQTVKVKIVSIAEDGKIALSIKKALPREERPRDSKPRPDFKKREAGNQNGGSRPPMPDKDKDAPQRPFRPAPKKPVKKEPVMDITQAEYAYEPKSTVTDAGFEDMLAKFKSSSEDRMSTLKRSMDVKSRNRRK